MKTRKTFLDAALLSLLLLGGCDGIPNIDKTDYFKEYKLETKATEAEIQQIRNGLLGSSSELSSVTMRNESYRRDALSESFDASDITVKILEDSFIPDVLVTEANETTSKQSKTGGVTVKESTKIEKKEWETSNSDYKITFKKETTNGKTKEILRKTIIIFDLISVGAALVVSLGGTLIYSAIRGHIFVDSLLIYSLPILAALAIALPIGMVYSNLVYGKRELAPEIEETPAEEPVNLDKPEE